jgi:hypothetical protein
MATNFALGVTGFNDTQPFVAGAKEKSLRNFINYLKGLLGGFNNGNVTVHCRGDAVSASGTITLATCLTGSVIEVNGVPFTAITSGVPVVANGEFVISGTDAADATSLAAAINGSTNAAISGVVTATSTGASGVVTVTSTAKGYLGNALTLVSKGVVARAEIKPTSADADDTVTINGVTLTAKQQRATGTLTAATAIAGDTFSIRGFTPSSSRSTRTSVSPASSRRATPPALSLSGRLLLERLATASP